MSVPTVCTIVVLAAVGAGCCFLQLRRAVRESRNRDRTADARARVGLPPAADDNVPGTHLADLDACELIWATPSPDDAAAAIDEGLTRLFERLGPPADAPETDADWLRDAVRDAFRDALREHRGEDPA
ncbi:hypothetical protein [Streptomyces caniscabiei]|uniref:hypothetical protein n=1 Tax=Streptomyces caniscabiei TaxID=2746961 RepID=UPI0018723E18|nr:hypothetical protein [Streptomyces caniscabiei]MBE4796180.1 hypothetical protein [Streptomyces caniscabiei]MDX2944488.1 hypothetical protein [Streptomyces caniscabiei]